MTNRLSKQKIFDKVATHLLTQLSVSKNNYGYCVFRGTGGKKCAVGCLLDDDLADELDKYNNPVESLQYALPYSIKHQVKFLSELQHVHDRKHPATWLNELMELAKQHKLNLKAINFTTEIAL